MQDRYVGDVGDYAKYGLLRALTAGSLRLGVNWYLFPDEVHNGDGRHISYLKDVAYEALDPELHRALATLVASGARAVSRVARSGILPSNTLNFVEPVPPRTAGRPEATVADRLKWALAASEALLGADIVFLDPDNGIEVVSVPPTSPKAGKYVLWSEIAAHWAKSRSLVVYHHLNRTKTIAAQVEDLKRSFRDKLGPIPYLSTPVFRRGSCRAFCVAGQERHAAVLRGRLDALLASDWSRHYAAPDLRSI